jgi:hypothetical protein
LEKIPADMITLDPNEIATVSSDPADILKKKQQLMFEVLLLSLSLIPPG